MTTKHLLGPDGHRLAGEPPDFGRRRFAQMAGSTILAAPMLAPVLAPTQAGANPRDDEEVQRFVEQIILNGGAFGRVILTTIVLVYSGQFFFADVSQGRPSFPEDRLGLGGVLEGVLRATIPENLQRAVAIGNAYLIGSTLILYIAALTTPITPLNMSLLLAHRRVSWEIARLQVARAIQGLPPVTDIPTLQAIGTLYLVSQSFLMALIPPPNYS
ncbi:MAG: hypothetical protein AAF914_01855 [Pseudomonadota bacterium]